eukprot:gene50983-68245_t
MSSVLLNGCTTPPKEHTAPCKRPANALSFADDPRLDCGTTRTINNADQAMAAILMLDRIDNTGTSFSEHAYTIVGTEIMPLLKLMAVGYVAFYGLQLIFGTTRISASDIIYRIVRIVFIVTLVGNWGTFNTLFYTWLNSTPEDVGRAILTAISG